MSAIKATALVGKTNNPGATVSEQHHLWEPPIPCDVCGSTTAQMLFLVGLSDGSTMTCGVRCASRLLGTTTDAVYCWSKRRGTLAASPAAPQLHEVVR